MMTEQITPILSESLLALIPHGCYCYDERKGEQYICPFWEMITRGDREETHEEGYCHYLKEGDEILLWDQVKICGLNEFSQEEIEEMGREIESYRNESGVE